MPPKRTQAKSQGRRASPFPASKPAATAAAKSATKPKKAGTKQASEERTVSRVNLLKSEFGAKEDHLDSSALGELTNDILPIFRPTNFPQLRHYEAIEPSARLASQLLKHPSLRPILRTILTHDDFKPLNEFDGTDQLYEYPANLKPITQIDIDIIDAALDELADFVTIEPHTQKLQGAFTNALNEEKDDPDRIRTKHLPGLRSKIEIPARVFSRLNTATNNMSKAKDRDIPLLLSLRFSLAVDLAHEVCHALGFAVDGHLDAFDTEIFLPDAPTAEIGFEMERALFGGHCSVLWAQNAAHSKNAVRHHHKAKRRLSNLVGLHVVWDWPSRYIVEDYMHNDLSIWVRKDEVARLPMTEIAWRVSLTDLTRFFEDDFWDQKDPPTQLERKVGFAFKCVMQDEGKAPKQEAVEMDSKKLPAGYVLSEHHAVVKDGKS